jgi:hypothetical protein
LGLGIAQNIAAAATDLCLGYRHFDAAIKCADAAGAPTYMAASRPAGIPHEQATDRRHRRDRYGRSRPVLNSAPVEESNNVQGQQTRCDVMTLDEHVFGMSLIEQRQA